MIRLEDTEARRTRNPTSLANLPENCSCTPLRVSRLESLWTTTLEKQRHGTVINNGRLVNLKVARGWAIETASSEVDWVGQSIRFR